MTSPAPSNKALPPTMPVAIKRENNNGSSNVRAGITRRDSLGWGADDLLGMISHTPPAFSPGSLTMPMTKRGRSGSISSRLLSATDLEERGIIDRQQKGVLKDLIISGDEALQKALEKFDAGDASSLEALLDSGALNRKSSVDLLDDLDLGFLNVGSLGDTPKDEPYSTSARSESMDEWDELHFESAFHDSRDLLDTEFYGSSLGTSLPNSLPSMGLGITPPASFSFGEDFLESKVKSEASSTNTNGDEVKAHRDDASAATGEAGDSGTAASGAMSRPIGIPGAAGNVTTPGSLSRPFGAIDLNKPKPGGAPGAAGEAGGDKKPFVGAYSPDSRRKRIDKFLDKRLKRVWRKEVKYDVRKNFADSRLRVKGRFVKKEDEQLLRELLSFT